MKTVYLDTNIWIELERMSTRPDAPNGRILNRLEDRIAEGSLRLPLSITHCLEMTKHGDIGRRRSLWAFATRLSGCFGMITKESLLPSLIDAAVAKVFGMSCSKKPDSFFTSSGLFGLEFDGQLPPTKRALRALSTEQGWVSFWNDMSEDVHEQLLGDVRNSEKEFIARRNELKEPWRAIEPSLRRRAYIARLFMDMRGYYLASVKRLGRNPEEIEGLTMEDKLRLITEVPPLDVEVSLSVQHQQQWDRQECPNDVRDISHLCMAVPYCDVVITERYWVDKIKREKLDKKYGTQLSSELSYLLQV